MKLSKLLVAITVSLSVFLCSCSCEDVDLGHIENSGELDSFLPTPGMEKYEMKYNNTSIPMSYYSGNSTRVQIPVKETGKSGIVGKGGTYDCIEYYTIETEEFISSATSNLPAIFFVKKSKNYNPGGFTAITEKDDVDDVIEFSVSFYNKLPAPITRGMMTYESYMPYRSFTLSKNPSELVNKRNNFTQEFLPAVTLNGVVHENVYHLYLTSPQYTEDEKYINSYYPLNYIQGIYVKEGIGIIQAYASNGEKINIGLK